MKKIGKQCCKFMPMNSKQIIEIAVGVLAGVLIFFCVV